MLFFGLESPLLISAFEPLSIPSIRFLYWIHHSISSWIHTTLSTLYIASNIISKKKAYFHIKPFGAICILTIRGDIMNSDAWCFFRCWICSGNIQQEEIRNKEMCLRSQNAFNQNLGLFSMRPALSIPQIFFSHCWMLTKALYILVKNELVFLQLFSQTCRVLQSVVQRRILYSTFTNMMRQYVVSKVGFFD